MLRKILFWSHLSCGIIAGLAILTMAATGVLLTYERQVKNLVARIAYVPESERSARLSLDSLWERAVQLDPELVATSVVVDADPGAPVVFRAGRRGGLLLNPYSGERMEPAAPWLDDLFSDITGFHRWFNFSADERAVPRAIIGVSNLLFLFLIVSGLYLWLPRVWSWQPLRTRLFLQRRLPTSRARDFAWHHVFGIWCALPLLLVVISGSVFSFRWTGDLLYAAFGTERPGSSASSGAGAPRQALPGTAADADDFLSLDEVFAVISLLEADWQQVNISLPLAGQPQLQAVIDRGDGGQPQLRDSVTLDRRSGAVVESRPFAALPLNQRIRSTNRFLHTGQYFGLAGQTVAGLVSAFAVLMVWTGIALAWRRLVLPLLRRTRLPGPDTVLPVVLLVLVSGSAFPQDGERPPEEIVVTADRLQDFNDTRVTEAEGAQLISAEYIRAQQATTLADALRKTTSVQVDEAGGNQGTLVIVRGLQGDQVSVRVDGAPQNFNQVRHGGANTVWAEPDMYKSITVIPGVASNVYGNGSIGGVVKLETRDPSDVLVGDRWGMNFRLGHETNGNARYLASEAAYRFSDSLSGLLHLVSRDSTSYVDGDGKETLGGATGSDDLNLLGKLAYTPAPAHHFELSRRTLRKDYTARGAQSSGRAVSSTDQFIAVTDHSTALQYGFAPDGNPLVNANLRYTRMESERERTTANAPEIDLWGSKTDYLEVENTSLLNSGGAIPHEVRVGADFTRDDLITAYTDSVGNKLRRERRIAGAYISDAVALSPALLLIASARYDRYEASDRSSGASSDNSSVSPRLHVNYSPFATGPAAGLSVYGLIGRGFRAPSVHENFGRGDAAGVICDQGRRGFACTERLPNPALKAETSDSREFGIRYRFDGLFSATDQLRVQLGYVENDVADFIDQVDLEPGRIVVNGRPARVDRTSFTNIREARIEGWEYFINYASNRWFASLTAQTMEGYDRETGLNLRDVSPHSVNATVGTYLAAGRVRTGIDMMRRDGREVDEDSSFNRLGYTVYDLFASYRFSDRWSLQLRVENVLDELYTKRYQSLSVDPVSGTAQDLTYYQPGRNIKATLEIRL